MRVIVTGGRSAIGEAIIKRRLDFGDHVLTTASSEVTLADLKAKLPNTPQFESCLWNLSTPEKNSTEVRNFISQGVDALVLNASAPTRTLKRLHEISDAEIQDSFQTQMYGNAWLIRECLPKMMEQKFGRIVFISSMAIHGTSRYCLYSMAKSGIEGLLKVVGTDYGEYNIRANILRPGVIATDRNKRFWARSDYMKLMTELIPSKSLGEAIGIAEATDPLLGPNCYMNSSVIEVSGGFPNIRSDFMTTVKLKD